MSDGNPTPEHVVDNVTPIVAAPALTPRPREISDPFTWEKKALYGLLGGALLSIIVAVFLFGASTHDTYSQALHEILDESNDPISRAFFALSFGRAKDFALVKGAALLLSFLVVIIGALMVLKGAEVTYKLNLEAETKKSTLETSSPGLVMVTLGLVLAFGVLMTKSNIVIEPSNATHSAGAVRNDNGSSQEKNDAQLSPLPE